MRKLWATAFVFVFFLYSYSTQAGDLFTVDIDGEPALSYTIMNDGNSSSFHVFCGATTRAVFVFCNESECGLSFDYRFGNGETQHYEYQVDLSFTPLLQQALAQDSLSIFSGSESHTFDISDFRFKALYFAEECRAELGITDTLESIASGLVDAVQRGYVAYYGRPADPAGLGYWAEQLYIAEGLEGMIEGFAHSPESIALYSGQNASQRVSAIYQQLFNRPSDSAGLNYYSGELDSGRLSHASIMLDVLNGATGTDAQIIDNKITASKVFTEGLDTDSEKSLYSGDEALGKVRAWLAAIDENTNASTLNTDIRDILGINTNPDTGTNDNYSCSSSPYCTQISSCAQACFYYQQCGISRLDRDNDGIPCESYCSSPC